MTIYYSYNISNDDISANDNMEYKGEKRMSKENERFERVYSQGAVNVTEIWVDKETGVNYMYHASGYAGGLTVLLDEEGKPVISSL